MRKGVKQSVLFVCLSVCHSVNPVKILKSLFAVFDVIDVNVHVYM